MELYQVLVLFLLAAVFGYIGKTLTRDEREIYKRKQYFPLFKGILIILAILFLFQDRNISTIMISILIMIVSWEY